MIEQLDHDTDEGQDTYRDGSLSSTFTPLLLNEGFNMDHNGVLVATWHVDFRTPSERSQIGAVIKFSEADIAIERSGTIKLTKPPYYRQEGETLIYDPREGLVTKETVVRREVPVPTAEHARIQSLSDDINRALELSGEEGVTVNTTRKSRTITDTDRDSLEWGNDFWLFCTAMEPTSEVERKASLESLDPDYDHESLIPSPRIFAQMLARAYVEEYGAPHEEEQPMKHTIDGVFVGSTFHRHMLVVHGPVVYVDDPYAICTSALTAQNPLIRAMLPVFVKGKEYSDQREYRFVIPDKTPHETNWKIMPAPPMLVAAIGRRGDSNGTMVIPDLDTSEVETVPPSGTTDSPYIPRLPSPSIKQTDMAELNLASSTIPDHLRAANEEEPTNVFHETVGVYSAVVTLHEKIDGALMGIAAAQPERKPHLTSAAWYAERSIRKLCHRLGNPIAGISVMDDNSIVIEIRLSHWRDSECKLVVMPTGVYALTLKHENGKTPTSRFSWPLTGDHDMATSLGESDLDTIADFETPTGEAD